MSLPITVTDAFMHYLDELRLITRHATRCPLGLADPHQPTAHWAYSLPGDPGHVFEASGNAREWHHEALVHLWYRDAQGVIISRWIWRVAYYDPEGWVDTWYARSPHQTWQLMSDDLWILWLLQADAALWGQVI
ncbi:hypothetical protein [Sulfobacillus thermosulfidooxidans]|uniref:hypothetical protein n=1 Tax=Sulfobacillus thermosulfidooxidans TaxID=28034 RepID=UPI0006B67128|nr:hypothetical protein [Sulfobacillus thermosulfidooxidans]